MYREAVPSATLPEQPGDTSWSHNTLRSYPMVGMGSTCEDSGRYRVGACVKCGYEITMHLQSCGRVECPRCVGTWARRASERASSRVFGALHAQVTKHKPRHITFELEALDWKEAKRKAAEIGATGGVLVVHAHRIKERYAAMFEIMAARCACNRYTIVRESALGMEALEYSPHCHAIAYGKFVDVEKDSDKFEYRNIRRIGSQSDCEKVLSYLLGHTVQPAGSRCSAVRYFGICSPQKLKPSWTGVYHDALRCPCCDGDFVDKESGELILVRKFVALGWLRVTRRVGVTGGKRAPVAPTTVHGPVVPEGLCTFS